MEPVFFPTPVAFRRWLREHHATETEVLVGFYKKGSGKASMTWSQSVDEALCFGWIDGVVGRLDDERYTHRFTPRKKGSTWSAVNVRKVAALTEQGRMTPAGVAAFEARAADRTAIYAYENPEAAFTAEQQAQFEADPAAWAYFSARPPGYRRTATWWVISAKREETRARRLATLIEDSAAGRILKQYAR